jgi:DNA-binding transcriptional ArsR family regulator
MQEAVAAPIQKQAIERGSPYVFTAAQGILSGRPKGAEILNALMAHLLKCPDLCAFALDFSQVSFVDVSCADEMLNKLLLRLRSGELGNRFVHIEGANTSVRETIEAVLQLRELSALIEDETGIQLLGALKRPMREALDVLLERKCATSSEISEILDKNVNIVCNRLNALQRMGLVCRLRDGSVAGGGRQYYYVSIL